MSGPSAADSPAGEAWEERCREDRWPPARPVPFGAPYKGFGIYNTEYRTAINLTDRRYFFELTTSPNVIWADLTKLDLSPGAPVLEADPADIALSGDITARFRKLDKAPY